MVLPQDNQLEWIHDENGNSLALIVRHSYAPISTRFLTPDDYKQQLGFIVYPAGGNVVAHVHLPIKRNITGTSEVLIVRQGRARLDIYRADKTFLMSRILETGDLVLLIDGGHGFEFLEETILVEVKQGPYTGYTDKERIKG